METGATDGLYFRNAGFRFTAPPVCSSTSTTSGHGRDERIGVQDYYDGAEYIYQLVKAVTSHHGEERWTGRRRRRADALSHVDGQPAS